MNAPQYFRLDAISLLDVVGQDADKILHNLTTNDVAALKLGQGCESFVTDVRGKVLGHVVVFRMDDSLRMIGAPGQSQQLAEHADRYTIREDAEPRTLDEDFVAIVLSPDSVSSVGVAAEGSSDTPQLRSRSVELGAIQVSGYEVPWLGEGSLLLLVPQGEVNEIDTLLQNKSMHAGDESAFQRRRALCGFPWYGVDLDESNLPQEADRNQAAISFTKGCYLGQETVARLDALGQVQKKLVMWSIEGDCSVGSTLSSGEKTVGRLTSVATDDSGQVVAIGMARRSHFDAGASATGSDPVSGESYTGIVR